MAKFFVGQMVRLVKAVCPVNIGAQGVITNIGLWGDGDTLPTGQRVLGDGFADVVVKWGSILDYGYSMSDCGPCNSQSLEPILPEGAQPSEFSFTELMDNLGVVVA